MNTSYFPGLVARLLRRLSVMERVLTGAAFLLLIAAVFVDVASRELTGTGLHWARQVGVYANVVVVMFGLGMASAGGAHLRPRFADQWLPAAWHPWLDRAGDAGMALFCLSFAWLAAAVVADSIALQERSVALGIAVWPFQAVVPLAFALAGVRHVLYAVFPDQRPADVSALAAAGEGGEDR